MYNTSILCTYTTIENPIESNEIYQTEFLKIFGLSSYNQKAVDRITNTLYKKMKPAPGLNEILQEIKNSQMGVFCNIFTDIDESAADEFAFVCLFSYDLFHVFHLYICEYYSTDTIKPETIDSVKKAISVI
jgi:hypothetical protein